MDLSMVGTPELENVVNTIFDVIGEEKASLLIGGMLGKGVDRGMPNVIITEGRRAF